MPTDRMPSKRLVPAFVAFAILAFGGQAQETAYTAETAVPVQAQQPAHAGAAAQTAQDVWASRARLEDLARARQTEGTYAKREGPPSRAWTSMAQGGNFQQSQAQAFSQARMAATSYNEMNGHAAARGCKDLLAAKNNGRVDWFENTGWYQKAMKICEMLAKTSTSDLQEFVEDGGKQLLEQMQASGTGYLAKQSCDSLKEAKANGMVEGLEDQVWYPSVVRLCQMVDSTSQEQIAADEDQPESMSGMALEQTCKQFWRSHRDRTSLVTNQVYRSTLHMCSKLEQQRARGQGMNGSDLVERCKVYDRMKSSGRVHGVRGRVYLQKLAKMCKWLRRGEEAVEGHASASEGIEGEASEQGSDYAEYAAPAQVPAVAVAGAPPAAVFHV